jgi:hypothetical protein
MKLDLLLQTGSLITVAARSRAWVLTVCLLELLVGTPLKAWLFICFCVVLSFIGRGLCDGLIILPKESYQVSKNKVQELKKMRPRFSNNRRATGKEIKITNRFIHYSVIFCNKIGY